MRRLDTTRPERQLEYRRTPLDPLSRDTSHRTEGGWLWHTAAVAGITSKSMYRAIERWRRPRRTISNALSRRVKELGRRACVRWRATSHRLESYVGGVSWEVSTAARKPHRLDAMCSPMHARSSLACSSDQRGTYPCVPGLILARSSGFQPPSSYASRWIMVNESRLLSRSSCTCGDFSTSRLLIATASSTARSAPDYPSRSESRQRSLARGRCPSTDQLPEECSRNP